MTARVLVAAHHGICRLPSGIRPLSLWTRDLGSPTRIQPIQPAVERRGLPTGPQGSPTLANVQDRPPCASPGGGKGSAFSFLPSPSRCEAGALRTCPPPGPFSSAHETPTALSVEKSAFPGLRDLRRTLGLACTAAGGPNGHHLGLDDSPPSPSLPHPPSSSQKTLFTPRHLI